MGAQTLEVTAGTVTLAGDLSTSLPYYTLQLDAGASATIGVTQHLAALVLSGRKQVTAT